MLKKIYLIYWLVFFSFSLCFSIENKYYRNLSILLDLSKQENIKFNAIAEELGELIDCKKSIILTDSTTWENFKNKYQEMQSEEEKHDIGSYFHLLLSGWTIYKQDNFLLFMHDDYRKKIEGDLGLNLDKFELINADFAIDKLKENQIKKEIIQAYHKFFPYALQIKSIKFIDLLKDLLIPKSNINNIFWNIYFTGHGKNIYQTVGITEESFKNLLNLLENHINTNLFYYSSCFAGGKISDLIFNDQKFSYPILTQGFDCVVYPEKYFDQIFELIEKIKNNEPKTFENLATNVAKNNKYEIKNLFSLRLPNETRFHYIPVENFIFPINSKTSNNDILNITTSPVYYLLESTSLQTNLLLTENQSLILGTRGNACHYIETLNLDKEFLLNNLTLFDNKLAPYVFILELIAKFKITSMMYCRKIVLFDNIFLMNSKLNKLLVKHNNDIDEENTNKIDGNQCTEVSQNEETQESNNHIMKGFNFNNVILFINDDISYWPTLKIDQNNSSLTMNNRFNIFFIYDFSSYLFKYYNDDNHEMIKLDYDTSQKYLSLFDQNKNLVLNNKQPTWKIDNVLQNKLVRKLYPWAKTATTTLFALKNLVKNVVYETFDVN